MKRFPVYLLAMTFLAACTASSPMRVSGGGASQGVVTLSYDYSLMQQPTIDWQQGLEKAAAQCRKWGYSGAVPDGETDKTCRNKTEDGDCIAWTLSANFQCTGAQPQ